MFEGGLIEKWIKNHIPENKTNCDYSKSSLGAGHGKLEDSKGAYIILVVGLAAACVVLFVEVALKHGRLMLTALVGIQKGRPAMHENEILLQPLH